MSCTIFNKICAPGWVQESEVFAMENKLCSACLDAWRHEKALMVSALEKAAEEIENCHNRETPLTEEIRDVLRQVLTE